MAIEIADLNCVRTTLYIYICIYDMNGMRLNRFAPITFGIGHCHIAYAERSDSSLCSVQLYIYLPTSYTICVRIFNSEKISAQWKPFVLFHFRIGQCHTRNNSMLLLDMRICVTSTEQKKKNKKHKERKHKIEVKIWRYEIVIRAIGGAYAYTARVNWLSGWTKEKTRQCVIC